MLNQVSKNVWYASHVGSLLGGKSDVKMTIILNKEGKLLLISPIPLNDELQAEIDALGEVSAILAPNPFHNLYFEKAMATYTNAIGFVAPGLMQRFKKFSKYIELHNTSELNFDGVEIELYPYRGEWREVVLYAKQDKVLIVTDLCFNLHWANTNFAKLMFKLQGLWEKFTVSKIIKLMTNDKKTAREIIGRLEALPKNHLIMAHGKVLHEDVDNQFRMAFEWLK